MSLRKSVVPIVVILGATGVGKTKLSLQLAGLFGGQILSADSMQIYKNLDIVTNKASQEERLLIPHHFIDVCDPFKETYNVINFRDEALTLIDKLRASNTIPIIVGGTNYYIESLLWNFTIESEVIVDKSSIDCPKETELLEGLPSDEAAYSFLSSVDPVTASRLHPHNLRKINRAVEFYLRHGIPLGEIHSSQHSQDGASSISGALRWPKDNIVVFWLQCDREILNCRLNNRVNDMLAKGLLAELTSYRSKYQESNSLNTVPIDYESGLLQSIGFKEFHDYLSLEESDKYNVEGLKVLKEGIENMKIATRRYSRKQDRWVVNRFLKRPSVNTPNVYSLDTSNLDEWDTVVFGKAERVVSSAITSENPVYEHIPLVESHVPKVAVNMRCEVCGNRTFVFSHEWDAHLRSNRHKKRLKSMKRTVK